MYKYSLHKKSNKHICPSCGEKRFVRYVDNENSQFLSDKVGRCDREQSCGYHYPPKHYFNDNKQDYTPFIPNTIQQNSTQQTISFHKNEELELSLSNYDRNNFVKFLKSIFDTEEVSKLIKKYNIGTAKSWHDGTIFWQVDTENKTRGGKIILYNNVGKRTDYINWIHSLNIKKGLIKTFNQKQCLFGEHLISKDTKPIAIVESEKTACIMSILFDKYIWMATGSLQELKEEKIKVLKNRKIILYPDLGIEGKNGSPFNKWNSISNKLKSKGFDIQISSLLEEKGSKTEREKGFDIADYFLNNMEEKPKRIISISNKKVLKMYLKNKHFKTLIEVFNLTDINGNIIRFE